MKRLAVLTFFLLSLSAHANSMTDDMAIGAITSVAGATVGQQLNHPLIGAAIGGAVGGAIINKRHQSVAATTVAGYAMPAYYGAQPGYVTGEGRWYHHDHGRHLGWYRHGRGFHHED